MYNKKSNRTRQICNFTRLRQEILEAKTNQKGIKKTKILNFLKCAPSFIGCFAENEISSLVIHSFPSFFIVNTDQSNMPGSHWIAIGIFAKKIEIFDTLGFNIFNWSRVPCSLLAFLHKFAQTRDISILKRIQDDNSSLCGFFCIFYVVTRSNCSFRQLESLFSSKLTGNDSTLIKFFS